MKNSSDTPLASELEVDDPNSDVPNLPPPSYNEAMNSPEVNSNWQQQESQPLPPQGPPPQQQQQLRPPQHPSQQQSYSSLNSSISNHSYNRPSAPIPEKQSLRPPADTPVKLRPATVVNPNPYLPWVYSDSVKTCKKCGNTGYKLKKEKPCSSCWKRYRPNTRPPETKSELQRLVLNPPKPKPINPNVVSLPPGVRPMYQQPQSMGAGPMVVKPGDPRIGGVLCPRCNGRGLVHYFLDLDTCPVCRGMGRVGTNGRPL